MRVVYAPCLRQETEKAFEARCDRLVSVRAQIALHIGKPGVEQSTWWTVLKQAGLCKVLNRCHMLLHRLGAQSLAAQVFAKRL